MAGGGDLFELAPRGRLPIGRHADMFPNAYVAATSMMDIQLAEPGPAAGVAAVRGPLNRAPPGTAVGSGPTNLA